MPEILAVVVRPEDGLHGILSRVEDRPYMSGSTAKAVPPPSPAEEVEQAIAQFDDLLRTGQTIRAGKFFSSTLSDMVERAARRMAETGRLRGDERVVEKLHGHMMDSIAAPGSADGRAIRAENFGSVLKRRMQDAERRVSSGNRTTSEFQDDPTAFIHARRDEAAEVERRLDLLKFLKTLPEKHRRLVQMLMADDDMASIAAAFGTDEKSVYNWRMTVARAYPELRDLLR